MIESALNATPDTGCVLECLLNEAGDECVSCGRTLKNIQAEGIRAREAKKESTARYTIRKKFKDGV